MKTIEVSGGHVTYELLGDAGQWVTLVNGHTRARSDFKFLAQKLAKSGRRVLTLDNRASGESQVNEPFSLRDMALDVVQIWRKEGIEGSSLLGISMGGFICQTILQMEPSVGKVILISTALQKSAVVGQKQWGSTLEEITSRLSQYFSGRFLIASPLLIKAMAKQILKQSESGAFQRNANLQDNATEGFDLSKAPVNVTTKALIIHGTDDQIISCEEAGRLAEKFSFVRLQKLGSFGHLLLAECPQKLFEEIDLFLQ